MTISQIDIDGLAPPAVVEALDFETVLTAMRDDLVARFPPIQNVIDLESEPARKLLEVCAYREILLRARINDAARANLIAFATGSNLDHLAGFYDVVRLTGETDDALRHRTILTIAGRSTGGTAPRYRSVALGASVDVRDAVVWRDGTSPLVNVAVLSHAPDGVADAYLLSAVYEALTAPSVRMVNDTISVRSAVVGVVDVRADVWLLPETPLSVFDALADNLRASFADEGGLSFDLTTAWLTARLMRVGVQRVAVTEPSGDIVVARHEALSLGNITLSFKGRDV